MMTFIGPCPEDKEIDHIDGDRTNNNLSNLRYVSHSENVLNGVRNAKGKWGKPNAKLTEKEVLEIRKLKGKMTQRQIGKLFGVSKHAIHCIYHGKTWTYV